MLEWEYDTGDHIRQTGMRRVKSYFPGSLVGSEAGTPYWSPDLQTYRTEWAHRHWSDKRLIVHFYICSKHVKVGFFFFFKSLKDVILTECLTYLSRSESGSVFNAWAPDVVCDAFWADSAVSAVSWGPSALQMTDDTIFMYLYLIHIAYI